jgi:hypothetical protein
MSAFSIDQQIALLPTSILPSAYVLTSLISAGVAWTPLGVIRAIPKVPLSCEVFGTEGPWFRKKLKRRAS